MKETEGTDNGDNDESQGVIERVGPCIGSARDRITPELGRERMSAHKLNRRARIYESGGRTYDTTQDRATETSSGYGGLRKTVGERDRMWGCHGVRLS